MPLLLLWWWVVMVVVVVAVVVGGRRSATVCALHSVPNYQFTWCHGCWLCRELAARQGVPRPRLSTDGSVALRHPRMRGRRWPIHNRV